jgi:hypothetical protein
MYIFIDESGSFVTPRDAPHSVCCVAALAIPCSCLGTVVNMYQRRLKHWNPGAAEVKGSSLSERQVDGLITALGNFDVVLTVVCIDMGLHSETGIATHKKAQETKLRESVAGPEFFESFRDDVNELASRIAQLPNQLYVQLQILTDAIARTVQTTTLHFAQTEPNTLGTFAWHIDAKDKTLQECERLWLDLVGPMLQSTSLKTPLVTARGPGFDYSAFAKFENPTAAEPPSHLKPGMLSGASGPFNSIDTRKLVANVAFEDSRGNPGLQLVDILANAFRRACMGRLRERGWRRLGRLMVRDFRSGRAVDCLQLNTGRPLSPLPRMPYWVVLQGIDDNARHWEVTSRR